VLTRKIKFQNGSWVVLMQSDGYICEVHSNGLMLTRQDTRTMSEIAEEITERMDKTRGDILNAQNKS
jgi:phosphoribosylaminoimidazole (AIR) synthetase